MGNIQKNLCIAQPHKYFNEIVPDAPLFDRDAPCYARTGQVRMLIVGLNYKGCESIGDRDVLSSDRDVQAIRELAEICGVKDIEVLFETEATPKKFEAAIKRVCMRCEEHDYFVMYFAGHGVIERDSEDRSSFVLLDNKGSMVSYSNDRFSEAITSSLTSNARVLILCDSCHSANIAAFDSDIWDDIEAISICGCKLDQESEDIGNGGIFTYCLLFAIQRMDKRKAWDQDVTVGKVFNKILKLQQQIFPSFRQDFTISTSSATNPGGMAWPLIPLQPYQAPKKDWLVALKYKVGYYLK